MADQPKQEFEEGGRYLTKRTHMGFGGSLIEIKCDEIQDNYVRLNGHWYKVDEWFESHEIVKKLANRKYNG